VKGKYIVFDKGNNSKDNLKELDTLYEKYGCYFVNSVRPSMVNVKARLLPLTIEELPVIYEQKHTRLRGKTSIVRLYNKQRNILLYVNEEIAEKEQEEFLERLKEVPKQIQQINQKQWTIKEKWAAVESYLKKERVLSYFKRNKSGNAVICVPIQNKIEEKLQMAGKFAIITNDAKLDAESIIRIYKSTGVVERDFHILKSVFSLYPVKHRKPRRTKVHFALVIWGAMAFALLRYFLSQNDIALTFEELKNVVKEGYVSIGDYIYPGFKSFRIQRTLNFGPLLEVIFKIFELEYDYFDITVLPTLNKKNSKVHQKGGAIQRK